MLHIEPMGVRALLAMVFALGSAGLQGQTENNLARIHEIKTEAFAKSKVMQTLASVSDRYGPRLTASPEWEEAAQWAITELKSYGLENIHEEKWGPFGRSWSIESYTLDMLSPRYSHLVSVPLAWSSSTDGEQIGEVFYAPFFRRESSYAPKKLHEQVEHYKSQWHGKLKGRIVLLTEVSQPKPAMNPLFARYTDAQLSDMAKAPAPSIRRNISSVDQVDVPTDPEEAQKYLATLSSALSDEVFDAYLNELATLGSFLSAEGVAGVIRCDGRSHNGLLNAESAGSFTTKQPLAPPTFVVTEEQYSRMQRLNEQKQPVTVRMQLKARISQRDVDGANIIGEITGQKKPDEVVMIGAHFDSWASGTGATDNGAGGAVMIEVMRILKTLHLPLDRTVRIALWGGEEEGDLGSRAYVKAHYANVSTGEVKPDQSKFDVYLNLDNGSGKIRGIYLEDNDAARPLFDSWLAPFHDLGVTTLTMQHTTDTDHVSFDQAGLPGFQFIQDPLDYESLTHHSDVDTYSHAISEDLMQASAVIASLVYNIANSGDLVPRKQMVRNGKLMAY